jgi:hypothetical protein
MLIKNCVDNDEERVQIEEEVMMGCGIGSPNLPLASNKSAIVQNDEDSFEKVQLFLYILLSFGCGSSCSLQSNLLCFGEASCSIL